MEVSESGPVKNDEADIDKNEWEFRRHNNSTKRLSGPIGVL